MDSKLKFWESFYRRHFDLQLDLSSLKIPKLPGIGWILLIIANIEFEKIALRLRKLSFNDDIDLLGTSKNIITWNARDAKDGPYAIYVKNTRNTKESFGGIYTDEVKKRGIKTETLAERFIHDIYYFEKNGKNLDDNTITVCADSAIESYVWSRMTPVVTFVRNEYAGIAGTIISTEQSMHDCGDRMFYREVKM